MKTHPHTVLRSNQKQTYKIKENKTNHAVMMLYEDFHTKRYCEMHS